MDGYQAISDALPDNPARRHDRPLRRHVRRWTRITVVWSSKTHADRFETETLGPTIRRVMGPPSGESDVTFISLRSGRRRLRGSQTVIRRRRSRGPRRGAASSSGTGRRDGHPLPEPTAGRREGVGPRPAPTSSSTRASGSFTRRSPLARSVEAKNWRWMRRHGKPIIVERVTRVVRGTVRRDPRTSPRPGGLRSVVGMVSQFLGSRDPSIDGGGPGSGARRGTARPCRPRAPWAGRAPVRR